MYMPHAARHWTADEVRALPDDGNRYEVGDGALLVTPAPSWPHQRAVLVLAMRLREYLMRVHIGEVLLSPADVALGEAMVQPDIFITAHDASAPPGSWAQLAPLLLAIEVLSPGTARRDRFIKRRLYQRERIPEYWIVDLDARAIERWRPSDERPELLGERLEWRPEGATDALVIELEPLFREITGA
jgi:Uma2 family endonuclease